MGRQAVAAALLMTIQYQAYTCRAAAVRPALEQPPLHLRSARQAGMQASNNTTRMALSGGGLATMLFATKG